MKKKSTYDDLPPDLEALALVDDKYKSKAIWREKKCLSRDLAMSYHRLAHEASGLTQPTSHDIYKADGKARRFIKRANAVENCASFLEFKLYNDNSKKLLNANFCKNRLCPMCGWRRSLKVFEQVSKVVTKMQESSEYEYIFLTLTVANVRADALAAEITNLYKAFRNLTYRTNKAFNKVSKGWFRSLEVTHDTSPVVTKNMYYKRRPYYDKLGLTIGSPNPNYDTYHPHFHVLIAVDKDYFHSKDYLSTKQWVDIWQDCLGVSYSPIVYVKKVVPNKSATNDSISFGKAIAEVSKYATKSGDYLLKDRAMTDKSVYTLDEALAGRRLIGFGGLFRTIQKQLKLDDAQNGDLVHINDDEQVAEEPYIIVRYSWHINFNQYLLVHTESCIVPLTNTHNLEGG